MDILLTTPINKTHYCVPPLGLGYLMSSLRKAGFTSQALLNPVKEGFDFTRFADFLKKNNPRVLGVQCYSFEVAVVDRMVRLAKKINPEIITIIGGPHPSAVKESVFNDFENLDFALRGEGELSFPLFIKAVFEGSIPFEGIPGLVFRNKRTGGTTCNDPELIQDLDILDIPAWDSIDPGAYPELVEGAFYQNFPVAPIITSRGCPYECTFCANKILMGRKIRLRSVEKVVNEIEYLSRDHKIKEIHILDDNFSLSKSRVLDFCKSILDKKIKLSIAFPNGVRLDTLDQEILSALKQIGAYSITVAIESGSQKVLDHMKKKLNLTVVREKVALLKKNGFIVNAFFIIGYPTEKKKDILSTIEFARSLPLDIAHFSCFLPLPGTDITEELLNTGRLKKKNYEDLFYSKVPFAPEGMTKNQLKNFQKRAFLSFYLRGPVFINLVLRIKSFRHLNSIIKRAIDYVFK